MTGHLIIAAFAPGLSAVGSAAYAGNRCPFNDKELPEKSKVCRAGTIQVCEDGQWRSLGIKCTSKFSEDDRAASSVRRQPAAPRPQRDRIVARIAPRS